MALKKLPRCLDSNSIITHDVKFIFNNQLLGEPVTISAHKVILSIASDVFETQFYGDVKEPLDEVDIVDASYEAFKAMVEFIYNKRHDWESEDIHFLADMFYLGEKYILEDLKLEVVEAVNKIQVSQANVLELAALAERQSHHPKFSKPLYIIAAKFLQKKFNGDIIEVIKLFSEVEADSIDPTNSFILHKLMSTISEIPRICNNCKINPCLDGKEPTRLNFVAGAKVKIVRGKNFNSGINPIATLERLSRNNNKKFVGKKVTGFISCYFGKGCYLFKCK